MSITLSLLLLLLLSLLLLLRHKWQLWRLGSSLAGPWALPLLGNAQMVGKLKPEFIFLVFTELRERYARTYRLWLGPQLWVFLHSAEETRQALHDASLRKPDTFRQLQPLLGNGLLLSHGALWASQRRLLTPAFQPKLLRSFAPAVDRHAQRLLARLQGSAGAPIEPNDWLFSCLLDAILDTSMGYELNSQQLAQSPHVQAFHSISELLFKRMINPLMSSDFVYRRSALWRQLQPALQLIHQLVDRIVAQRRQQLEQQEQPQPQLPPALLDSLLLAQLEPQQVRDELNTFIFAGVDTSCAALNFVLYALAKHAAVQQQLHEELCSEAAASAEWQALSQLPYLDMLIKEVLRCYTIVPTTARQTTCRTSIGEHSYGAGVTLWLNLYGLAHDARYFPQPYEFRPERWASGQPATAYSYLPFSGGPHVCIGRRYALLLLKLLTVRIVQQFQLELDAEPPLVLQAQMVLKARDGIRLKFIRRRAVGADSTQQQLA